MKFTIIGIVFIMMSGMIYVLERGFSLISTSIVKAGFYAGTMTGEVPTVEAVGFTSNFFVPIFLVVGIIALIIGFEKKEWK